MYNVNNIEELYDTLDQGHRIYLGTREKKCVVPDIVGYVEKHNHGKHGTVIKGVPEKNLNDNPYYLYYLENNRKMGDKDEIVRISFFSPDAANITLFNRVTLNDEGFKKTVEDGIIFFIPEYIDHKQYDSIIRRS